jgi:hypothetical protein
LDYSRADIRDAAYEAVFIYCECAATKQIGLPEGEKVAIHKDRSLNNCVDV